MIAFPQIASARAFPVDRGASAAGAHAGADPKAINIAADFIEMLRQLGAATAAAASAPPVLPQPDPDGGAAAVAVPRRRSNAADDQPVSACGEEKGHDNPAVPVVAAPQLTLVATPKPVSGADADAAPQPHAKVVWAGMSAGEGDAQAADAPAGTEPSLQARQSVKRSPEAKIVWGGQGPSFSPAGSPSADSAPAQEIAAEQPSERSRTPGTLLPFVPRPHTIDTGTPFVPQATQSRDANGGFSFSRRGDDSPAESPFGARVPAPVFHFAAENFARLIASQSAPLPADRVLAPAASTSLPHEAQAELPQQIVQAVRLQLTNAGGDARIQLRPDYLGELTVSIKVEHGSVTASLAAERPAVREWLEANVQMLRQGLADQGLQLDSLVVGDDSHPDWDAPEDQRRRHQEQQPKRRARRQDDDATFELIA